MKRFQFLKVLALSLLLLAGAFAPDSANATKNATSKNWGALHTWSDGSQRSRVQRVYTTTCAATENPISEGGAWVSASQMSPRTDVRSSGNKCYGTAAAYNNDNIYRDSAAHLTGFAPNQEIVGVVSNTSASNLEIELFLHADFTSAHTFGYEIDLYINTGIISLVRWDGTSALPNVFTFLRDGNGHGGEAPGATGDIVRATWIARVITVKYTPISTGIETTLFTYDTSSDSIKLLSGQPGFGTFTNAGGTASSNLAWSSITARDL